MDWTKSALDELTYDVIGAAIEVHKHLGPGLLESVYKKCFLKELELRGLRYKQQVWVPLEYKGTKIDTELRLDTLVEDILCVELKSCKQFEPINYAILLSYMKMLNKPKGILINFNCMNLFKEGQKTFVNDLFSELPYS